MSLNKKENTEKSDRQKSAKAFTSLANKPALPSGKVSVSGNAAGFLKRAVAPVAKALALVSGKSMRLTEVFMTAAIGVAATAGALRKKDIKGTFKRAAIGVAEVATSVVFGMDTASLIDKVEEVSARLKNKKFISATAVALAAATQIGGEIVGQPVLGIAASTAILLATHALFGKADEPRGTPKLKPAYAFARP